MPPADTKLVKEQDFGDQISREEAIPLFAKDHLAYERHFFPHETRVPSAPFHKEMWEAMEKPNTRYINIQAFRGSGKTTKTRLYLSKRVAYGLSHTVLIIGVSDRMAIDTLDWLKQQVAYNTKWAEFYGLRRSEKWANDDMEIYHSLYNQRIRVRAVGIDGSIRGFNVSGYRPDLILLDDILKDDHVNTPDGRRKTTDKVYSAIAPSLPPPRLSPTARLISLSTPLHAEDYTCLAMKDPTWHSLRFGVLTTDGIPHSKYGESRWPEVFPKEKLLEDYDKAFRSNRASLWMREQQCELLSPDKQIFNENWLRRDDSLPKYGKYIIAIDPAPPPTKLQYQRGDMKTDFEVFSVLFVADGKTLDYPNQNIIWLVETVSHRGHDADHTLKTYCSLASKYGPVAVVCEAVAYQATLLNLLERETQRLGLPLSVFPFKDNRNKYSRITDALQLRSSDGRFRLKGDQPNFVTEFREYGQSGCMDDHLDSVAMGVLFVDNTPYMFSDTFHTDKPTFMEPTI